jgi:O-antigen ligase
LIAQVHKILIWSLGLLFLVAAGLYAFTEEIYFVLAPFVLLACFFLVQHPRYLLYLLVLSIPWSVEYHFNQNLGTDLPDEPLMLLTALAALILISLKGRTGPRFHPILFLLLLQFLWILITVICSTDTGVSFKYLLAKSWYLLAFVGTPLFLFRDEKVLKQAAVLLLCSMMAFMFLALIRHAGYGLRFEKVNDALTPFYRNHVNYSALLAFMVPLQLALLGLHPSKKVRGICSLILIITVAALYFSYARGAWLALLTGLLAYWLIRKRLLLPGFFLFFFLCVASILWLGSNDRYLKFTNDYKSTIFHTDFREHLVATYQLKDLSSAERFYRWLAGVRMIPDSWETGFGPTTFYEQYKAYTVPAFRTWVSRNGEHSTVHNYFLLTAIEQGIPGLLLLLVLLGALFWYAQKIYHRTDEKFWKLTIASAAAILMMVCTVNFLSDLIETDKVGSVFYLCIATIIVADIKTKH